MLPEMSDMSNGSKTGACKLENETPAETRRSQSSSLTRIISKD